MLGNFACFIVVRWFFQNKLFQKILLGIWSKCQTIWTKIRPNILTYLILLQTICKIYLQTSRKKVKVEILLNSQQIYVHSMNVVDNPLALWWGARVRSPASPVCWDGILSCGPIAIWPQLSIGCFAGFKSHYWMVKTHVFIRQVMFCFLPANC